MTVSYQYEVASSTSGGFTRLLFMWRGSLYKLIYRELLLFWSLFISLSALYRHAFTTVQKRAFEHIVVYCDTFINLIPLSFVLGFYVAYVAGRWWQQYMAIPWPDKVMHLVALYVTGNDEYGRMLRRSLMRYLNLSLILVLRSISSAVKRRFPTLDHVVDSGFMTHLELELFQSVPSLEFNTYWIPCTWFINLLKEARRSHRIPDAQGLKIIMEEFNDFRSKCGLLWSYDWVSIPLVYTQVVTLATYSFFAVALVGRQYIEGTEKSFQMKLDVYLPVFTILQFFFFMGLLKVAEQLINPFGDDDEDFELNWIIDRHTKVSYLGVDILMNRCPPLTKDIFFDAENITLPYTEAAAAYKRKTYRGSVANMTVPEKKQTMFLPDIEEEEEEEKKGNMTPQTSSASLSTFDSENVTHNKRQISGSPEISPRMVRNMSETTIQMDTPEALIEPSEPERYSLSEKMRRLTKCSTPRPEQRTRMPFHAGSKAPQTPLQPWPSATNLMHPNVEDSVPAAGLSKLAKKNPGLRITLQRPSIDEESDEMDFEVPVGETNLSLSQEKEEPEEPKSCDCKNTLSSSEQNRDVCQVQCLHENICQHAEESGEPIFTRPRLHTCPKYFPRRQQLSSSERWKRGSRWKAMFRKKSIKTRRRTVDSVPASSGSTYEKTMVQTKSYPNLPLSEQFVLRDLAEPKATGTTEETGSTSKSKEEVDD